MRYGIGRRVRAGTLLGTFLLGTTGVPAKAASASPADSAATAAYQPLITSRSLVVPSERRSKKKWKKAWIATWVAFAVVNALDTHSSLGRREQNPLLRNEQGRFSARKAILLKSAVGGAFFGVQWWMARRNPDKNYYKTFTLATGAASTGLGLVAARNYRLGQRTADSAPVRPSYLMREPKSER